MACQRVESRDSNIHQLQSVINIARSEINNLRQQIRSLNAKHEKEMNDVSRLLQNWRCEGCRNKECDNGIKRDSRSEICTPQATTSGHSRTAVDSSKFELKPIGVVSSWYPEKRGTPRQPGVSGNSRGKLTLYNTVFTNPDHALEGLEDYSHMWILFYFHKNDSTHVRAKVAPPRLNGIRTGVYATRSPHRPCPIGLSLVQIDKVEDWSVYFSGVDMVDGTPVLDIKPYIPQYDDPLHCQHPLLSGDSPDSRLIIDGGRDSDEEDLVPILSLDLAPRQSSLAPPGRSPGRGDSLTLLAHSPIREASFMVREAPDGEEGLGLAQAIGRPSTSPAVSPGLSMAQIRSQGLVRVPAWLAEPPVTRLDVTFSEGALSQLTSIQESRNESVEDARTAIQSVLQEDPRSVYLRQRWNNQFYTFLIAGLHVSCRFDDNANTVTVFRVTAASKNCECGIPEWQCSIHNALPS